MWLVSALGREFGLGNCRRCFIMCCCSTMSTIQSVSQLCQNSDAPIPLPHSILIFLSLPPAPIVSPLFMAHCFAKLAVRIKFKKNLKAYESKFLKQVYLIGQLRKLLPFVWNFLKFSTRSEKLKWCRIGAKVETIASTYQAVYI